MDFGVYFYSFCAGRDKRTSMRSPPTAQVTGLRAWGKCRDMGLKDCFWFRYLVSVQIIRQQLGDIYTCKNIIKYKVIFQRFTIENPVLYIQNHEENSWVKMNRKFRLNVMTSKMHILLIYRGYFRFPEERTGRGRRCRRRETYLVMKESSDPFLKFEDYNHAGRNRTYFRDLVQNKEHNTTKSETTSLPDKLWITMWFSGL